MIRHHHHHPSARSSISLRIGGDTLPTPARRRRGGGGATSPSIALARAIKTSPTTPRPPSLIAAAINRDGLVTSTTTPRRSAGPHHRPEVAAASSASASASPEASSSSSPSTCWKLLRDFSAAEFRRQARPWVDTPEKRARLRDALMTVYRQPAPSESGYGWAGVAEAVAAGDATTPADVIVGVTASDARVAVRALRDWCAALGLPYVQPEVRLGGRPAAAGGGGDGGNNTATTTPTPLAALPPGPVYVKYAPAGGVCYASPYTGPDRGVLLQLGQAPLLGHFPLGLMDASAAA